MASELTRSRWGWIAAFLLLSAIGYAVYFHSTVPVLPYDDAFITFRYANNALQGNGPVYNPGERVFGSSSPLYCLWLIAIKTCAAPVALPVLAVRANVVFHLACVLGVAALITSLTRRITVGLLAGAVYALDPRMLIISAGGMESFLFLALVLWACVSLIRGNYRTGLLLASFSVLARPEGVLILTLGIVLWIVRDRKRPLAATACAIGPLALWVIFAGIYYGSPVPQSILAKSAPLYPLEPWTALKTALRYMSEWLFPHSEPPGGTVRWWINLSLIAVATIGALSSRSARRGSAWLPCVLLIALTTGYALGNPKLFEWYLPPVHALWFLTLVAGIPLLLHAIFGRFRKPRADGSPPEMPILLLILAGLTIPAVGVARSFFVLESSATSIVERVNTPVRLRTVPYRKAAEWLNARSTDATRIVAAEIGSLGFHFRGRAIDACALVSPAAMKYLPVPPNKRFAPGVAPIPADLVRDTRPDFVVTMPIFSFGNLDRSRWFRRHYSLVHAEPLDVRCWGNSDILIYAKRQSSDVLD